MNDILRGHYHIRYLEDELYNENLHREIQMCCGGRIQMTIIDRYLFDYYAANRDKYRNKDIEYEVYRINCNYRVISVNVTNNDENTVRVDYMFSIEPYLSNNKKLFSMSVSAIFDKDSCEFVRFEYSPPEVIYRDDLISKKED